MINLKPTLGKHGKDLDGRVAGWVADDSCIDVRGGGVGGIGRSFFFRSWKRGIENFGIVCCYVVSWSYTDFCL